MQVPDAHVEGLGGSLAEYGCIVRYQAKPHSHVVPAGYLRPWTHGAKIAMRLVGREQVSTSVRNVGVRSVGVRKNIYRRERPTTGETIHDTEWSNQQLENEALPVISSLASRWPLGMDDKGRVALFFALQYVRGPAFKAWHERHMQPIIDAVRSDPVATTVPTPDESPEEVADKVIGHLSSDTHRLVKMIKATRTVAVAFGSMRWTLVTFAKPRLVTSDQPVVVWPLARGRARPCPNDLNSGVTDTLEVFVPIASQLLLLMTWIRGPDLPAVIPGANRHIATANAFVVANADAQWFHEPGVKPWRLAAGPRDPLSAELIPGYDVEAASRSKRRQDVAPLVTAEAQAPVGNQPISMLPR